MIKPNEIRDEVVRIRSAIDSLEVKGAQNANALLYAFNRCSNLIGAIDEILQSAEAAPVMTLEKVNTEEEVSNVSD